MILSAIKHTPLSLKITNFVSWFVIATSEKISNSVDFLNPEVAQSISLYCAAFLSVVTAIIAIYKEIRRIRNAKKND